MAFTVNDLRDLTRLLLERPEWLGEVRRIVLTEELLSLPDIVRGLAEAQRRTDEQIAELVKAQQRTEQRLDQLATRVDQLTERLDQLAARVDQLTERLDQLAARVDQLTERLDRLTARVDQLTERLDQLTARVDQLTARVNELTERLNQLVARVDRIDQRVERLENQMADVRGSLLEMKYRDRAPSFFGTWLRRLRVVDMNFVLDDLEDRLSREEIGRLLPLDLLVRGQLPKDQGGGEVWLAVEVSTTIDAGDVRRAVERAGLLRKAGLRAVPVVAGEGLAGDNVAELIAAQHVAVVMDGSRAGWEQALEHARP